MEKEVYLDHQIATETRTSVVICDLTSAPVQLPKTSKMKWPNLSCCIKSSSTINVL